MQEAFKILGFTDDERDASYKITCGVMMMGDMVYKQKPRDEQAEVESTGGNYTRVVIITYK